MNLKISNKQLKENASRTLKRFPIVVTFIMLSTIALSSMIISDKYYGSLIFYLLAGSLISLVMKLWYEDAQNKIKYIITSVILHFLLIIDAIYIYFSPEGNEKTIIISQASIIVILILGFCFVPFLKEKDDVTSWHHVRRSIFSAIISFIISAIVGGGIMLLLSSLNPLFDIFVESSVFLIIAVIFCITIPSLIFLSRIPVGENKFVRATEISSFLLGTIRYLFIPLVLSYIIVMYLYVLKVILKMELPNGAVSWLVTTMIISYLAVIYLQYPHLKGNSNTIEKKMTHYLPIVMLPPIILMTIGIIRRFSDYGITDNRLYILTLNIWFYIVCIGLFLQKSHRIHWISLSFGLIFFVTSALPVNYRNISKWVIKKEISSFLLQNSPKELPMNQEELKSWLESLDKKDSKKIYEKLRYINMDYSKIESKDWLTKDVNLWSNYDSFIGSTDNSTSVINYENDKGLKVTNEYSAIDYINIYQTEFEFNEQNKDSAEVSIETNSKLVDNNNGKLVLLLDLGNLKKVNKTEKQLIITTSNSNFKIAPISLGITKTENKYYISLSAFLLKK